MTAGLRLALIGIIAGVLVPAALVIFLGLGKPLPASLERTLVGRVAARAQ